MKSNKISLFFCIFFVLCSTLLLFMGSIQFVGIFEDLNVSNDLTIKYVVGSLFYIFGILLIGPMTFFWLIYLIWVFDKKIKINKDEPIIIEKYKF